MIGACRDAFAVAPGAEVTLEPIPRPSPAKIADYRSAGVNRISLGVQSLHDRELRRLDRQHSAARARQASTMSVRRASTTSAST